MGGGFLGPQSRTNVTIFDNEKNIISAINTIPINLNNSNTMTRLAGNNFTIIIQVYYFNTTAQNQISSGSNVRRSLLENIKYIENSKNIENLKNIENQNDEKFWNLGSRSLAAIEPETMGGEIFLSMIENDYSFSSDKNQRNNLRKIANVTDNGDGTYTFISSLSLQGRYQQRIFLAMPKVISCPLFISLNCIFLFPVYFYFYFWNFIDLSVFF